MTWKQCPGCGGTYPENKDDLQNQWNVEKADEPCGKCDEKGVENREARL